MKSGAFYIRKWLPVILFNLLLFLILAELAFRWMGYSGLYRFSLHSSPTPCLTTSDRYGFRLLPGSFDVSISHKHEYQATHHSFGDRIVRANCPAPDTTNGRQIILTGCSFIYGMGVDDQETMACHLQRFQGTSEWKVVNAGVPAHGTMQSLLYLEELIASGQAPDVFIYNYLDFHQERNVLHPLFQHQLYQESSVDGQENSLPFIFPKGRFNQEGMLTIRYDTIRSQNLLGGLRSYSALINQLEFYYNRFRDTEQPQEDITLAALRRMNRLCQASNILFIITVMQEEKEDGLVIDFCRAEQIPFADLRLDFTSEENINYPHDGHPSSFAHKIMAERLGPFLNHHLNITE